ncbi:hypothetical protein [Nonomuraea zeae]|uniref:DUF4352 domain-containing protein n=1 Tax=Nonomuraea zeae TaxID=1642303 RepID=A0A5S4FHU7_9ACTN|nr:hypothetical protein [Nonomuraea zeae]TMR08595.1 hypothetical protein ETD85_62140 [Nonomuraea zeae]
MTATEQRSGVAPARRSRRAGRRRDGSKLLGLVAGLILVGGAIGMQTLSLSEGEIGDPLTYAGEKGETVDAGRFTVRLDSFVTAKSIQNGSKTVATDNLFLVVSAAAKSSLKPYHLGQPLLVTSDGKTFDATDRVDSSVTLAAKWAQPEIWVSGRFFFEVPASALPGAAVRFRLPPTAGLQEPYRPEVEFDLGLDEEGARKLAGSAQAVYSTVEK